MYLFLLIELFSFIFSKLELLSYNETPNIYLKNKDLYPVDKWRTEEKKWGSWHKTNSEINHIKSCWNVTYKGNNVGARDYDFKLKSNEKRTIILGDSMGEGIGLNLDNRFDTIIENQINHNILNFSSGGDLGPLAYYILYENLAFEYDHENLAIFFLPQNDFTDHNYNIWEKNGWNILNLKKRYRPYSRKKGDNYYDFFYEEDAVKTKSFGSADNSVIFNTKLFLKKYFWSTNTLRTIIHLIKSKNLKKNYNYSNNSFYSNILDAEYDSFFWLEKIINKATEKKVYLFILPSYYDLTYIKINNLKKPIWQKKLNDLKKHKNLKSIIDLSIYFNDEPKSYFHKCDLHYNKKSNKIIADIFGKIISKDKIN